MTSYMNDTKFYYQQAVVSELVTKWELENPKDNFYIRVKKDNDDEFNQGMFFFNDLILNIIYILRAFV